MAAPPLEMIPNAGGGAAQQSTRPLVHNTESKNWFGGQRLTSRLSASAPACILHGESHPPLAQCSPSTGLGTSEQWL